MAKFQPTGMTAGQAEELAEKYAAHSGSAYVGRDADGDHGFRFGEKDAPGTVYRWYSTEQLKEFFAEHPTGNPPPRTAA